MNAKLFIELRDELEEAVRARDTVRSERDLCLRQLELQTYRLFELIAGIKALSEMLQVKRPKKAEQQAAEALVNRLIDTARRDYLTLLADEKAVCNLRKVKGEE